MLFGGSNPWSGGMSPLFGRRGPVQQAPAQQFPIQQFPVQGGTPPYPAPTWPGATPDGNYSQGLAGYYANQLQNQQVPGSAVPQMTPPQATPAAPPSQPGVPQQAVQPGWHDAFRQAMDGWQQQRPDQHGDLFSQWRQARPSPNAYRTGAM